ncbi:MAG: iron-containing alcohol dehydrogenase, partial [Micromonosporaceae bacterium]|nr:iron-containing alcohol dehydrogenase [Micromonosporaceae bacterium]
ACGYPIAGMVRDYHPAGYPPGEPMVPHGQSVSLTAPAAFRFTFATSPERHLRAASLLAPDDEAAADPAERLPAALTALMRDIGVPNGLAAVGYSNADVPELVEGAVKQQRLLAVAPCAVTAENLEAIFRGSL